jgi:uncharacterized repeat protein (TIGR02543 family)
MKKSAFSVMLALVLAGCSMGDVWLEWAEQGADAVAKTIEITGLPGSGIEETAQVDVFSGGPLNPEYAATGSDAIAADQTLTVELYEWDKTERWTDSGEWYICLWLAEGEGSSDYLWEGTIENAVTTLLFKDFTPSAEVVTLTDITVTGPTKTDYTEGEPFDPAGLVVTAHYSNGTDETVTDYTLTWDGTDLADTAITAAAGDKTVTVSYEGKTAEFKIAVSAVTLTDITVTGPTKTDYTVGEPFDPAGLVVTAHYSDGTDAEVTDYTLTWDGAALADTAITTAAGDKTVTVSYGGKTAPFTITVTTPSSVIVTFNADGGSPATQTRTVVSGGSVGSLPSNPTKNGYTFGGWYTLKSGNGTKFTGSTTVTAALTVYAKWTGGGGVTFNIPW